MYVYLFNGNPNAPTLKNHASGYYPAMVGPRQIRKKKTSRRSPYTSWKTTNPVETPSNPLGSRRKFVHIRRTIASSPRPGGPIVRSCCSQSERPRATLRWCAIAPARFRHLCEYIIPIGPLSLSTLSLHTHSRPCQSRQDQRRCLCYIYQALIYQLGLRTDAELEDRFRNGRLALSRQTLRLVCCLRLRRNMRIGDTCSKLLEYGVRGNGGACCVNVPLNLGEGLGMPRMSMNCCLPSIGRMREQVVVDMLWWDTLNRCEKLAGIVE